MGDRTNPIKFGPEWLRNLSREPSIVGAQASTARDSGAEAASLRQSGVRPAGPAQNPTTNAPKVLLARLRYGREEMLALYDRQTAEAPPQLKYNDTLYQPRGKPPYALNNSFEEDTVLQRDSVIRQPPVNSLMSTNDRYTGAGRGRGMPMTDAKTRIPPLVEVRGKSRGYSRNTAGGRGWHSNRVSGTGIPDDDSNQPLRPWSNNNHQSPPSLRPNNGEQPDWQSKQNQYRTKRQTSTNWRQQPGREEGEEWRYSDSARRPQDKWVEWGWQQEGSGRPTQDKQWHTNRRTWIGNEPSEDPLPEWAVDSAEACGGTFDSSGAFHGYSNDDSNIPKNQENPYPLTKSHTHGSFSRSKMAEEGSEEWWASEKAKKLSPKRFDASEMQFKKVRFEALSTTNAHEQSDVTKNQASDEPSPKATGAIPKKAYQNLPVHTSRLQDKLVNTSDGTDKHKDKQEITAVTVTELEQRKTAEIAKDKASESRSDDDKADDKKVQSVILPSNNTLRQKHQNISITPTETPKRQPPVFMDYVMNRPRQTIGEAGADQFETRKDTESVKIVEDILQMNLDDGIPSAAINQLLTSNNNSSMNSLAQAPYQNSMSLTLANALQGLSLKTPNIRATLPIGVQQHEAYNGMGQPRGITNSMLNASLGLPMPNSSTGMPQGITQSNRNTLASGLQGVGNMQQPALQPSNLQAAGMQSGQVSGLHNMQGLQAFDMQPGAPLQSQLGGMPSNIPGSGPTPSLQAAQNALPGIRNSPLFNNMQLMNNLPNDPAEAMRRNYQSFNNMLYSGNVMNQPPPINNMGMQQLITSEQWYYEDPNNTIQGPFSSSEMYFWYRAGFFNPSLMVRRGCDTVMRPLGSYGSMPFGSMDLHSSFPIGGAYDIPAQQSHDNMMNQQPGLGADVQSLWGQPANNAPAPASDRMWMPPMNNNPRNENPINNLPLHFWNNQASELPSNPLLPDTIKTEEEILAQMRAAQSQGPNSPLSFFAESLVATQEVDLTTSDVGLNLHQLQMLLQKDDVSTADTELASTEQQQDSEKTVKSAKDTIDEAISNKSVDKPAEEKPAKEVAKIDSGKQKIKDNVPKPKNKKAKDEKKEEATEVKAKEEEVKLEKRSADPSPAPKVKKDEKSSKKELDKEKKGWIKEGFTIVKGAEKTKDKENKKKAEEVKVAEEAERKRKEEEKLAAEEKKRQSEAIKKQQESQSQLVSNALRHAVESVSKKAPWSASSQAVPSTRDAITLAEIQRLEREKKLEQMKEQQQMMHIIAQQHAAALAREQEVQAVLGWAKNPTTVAPHPTLAEIQAEARKQATATPPEETQPTPPPPVNIVPWSNLNNGGDCFVSGGFWDSPQAEIVVPVVKTAEPKPEVKNKKKVTVVTPPKAENTPSVEFEMWCANMLLSWRNSGIDVPTFVSFLRDIESPYEVKDYVKCYLGDTREASEFSRQFLEKRSRLLRVGMITPSDDLCSPAAAINPRTNSGSDHADLKAKGKKIKKNKMLKVDARNILGFSVTASEDRINVGDIDTA